MKKLSQMTILFAWNWSEYVSWNHQWVQKVHGLQKKYLYGIAVCIIPCHQVIFQYFEI